MKLLSQSDSGIVSVGQGCGDINAGENRADFFDWKLKRFAQWL
jgi:hypothetical protein